MTLADIKINPLFQNLLPPLSDEEYSGLETDIVKQGRIINPIIVWSKDNTIIDGHNRYKILIAHKMNTENIVTMDFDDESNVIEWIYNNQKNRRNLTKSQLVHVWSEWEKQRAKEAEAKLHLSQGRGIKGSSNLNEVKSDPIRTAAEVAKKIGVSENTYRAMKIVSEKGTPDQIARMDKGGLGNGVQRIAQEILDGVPDGYMKCIRCGAIKPINEFVYETKSGGYIRRCKACERIRGIEKTKRKKELKSQTINDAEDAKPDNTPVHFKPEDKRYSYAPREDYYNTEKSLKWTYAEVKGETDRLFKKAIEDIKFIFNQHKDDVFTEGAVIVQFANEIQRYCSELKYVEREIRNEANRKGKDENGE